MFKDHTYTETALPGCSFDLIRLPGGTFIMGATKDKSHPNYDPEAASNETPHEVTLDSFLMGKYPVTQRLWVAVMGENPSHFQENGEERPIENVSWYNAVVFCNRLSQITGRKPFYLNKQDDIFGLKNKAWELPNEGEVRCDPDANGYRLPTEAQWEYAARGGNPSPHRFAGSDALGSVGWYSQNSGNGTHPVGLLIPNEFGLYDLSGNVWEWCADWYGSYEKTPKPNPTGPKQGGHRVLRGGGWHFSPRLCPASFRFHFRPGGRNNVFGFRLALQSVDNHPA
jgi:formylglycine-generating enzyme required for sulfatase activity